MVNQTVSIQSRKNLAQISRVLEQISIGVEFGDEDPCYVPMNDWISNQGIRQVASWALDGTELGDFFICVNC